MTIMEAMLARHSVRQYENRFLETAVLEEIRKELEACNRESGLHIQLAANEPKAFNSLMAHYGKFSGVSNYFALVGKKDNGLEEKCGWYGEHLALKAQQLGLNTCWVALTYSKNKAAVTVDRGEKLCAVIALGYGKTQGNARQSKTFEEVANVSSTPPEWFRKGVEAALLAPTAMNQQKFLFSLQGTLVSAKAGKGFYTSMDLGIAKYHFEVGAGKDNFQWAS